MRFSRAHIILCLAVLCLVALVSAPSAVSQESAISNARVIEMSKMGLGDDIIIARLKTGTCNFSLADRDLAELKKAGVSDKVVAAMLEASVITEPRVSVAGKPVVLHTFGQAKVGGRLGSAFTYGIKSVKSKAYLQGPHSSVIVPPNAPIELELPKGDTIDNYLLVKLDKKDDRREMEVGSFGGVVGGKSGIRAEAILRFSKNPTGANKFKLIPENMIAGEYLLYVVGSIDNVKGIFGKGYDFTVE